MAAAAENARLEMRGAHRGAAGCLPQQTPTGARLRKGGEAPPGTGGGGGANGAGELAEQSTTRLEEREARGTRVVTQTELCAEPACGEWEWSQRAFCREPKSPLRGMNDPEERGAPPLPRGRQYWPLRPWRPPYNWPWPV